MSIGEVISLMRGAVTQIITIIAPILGLALIVGLIVAILQAVTSIQEQTLTFIPKIVGVFTALMIFGPWMLSVLTDYINNLWANFSIYLG